MAAINFREAVVGFALAVKELQHDHSTDMLLQVSIDARYGGTNPTIRVTNFVAKDLGGHHNQRQHRKGNQGQLPVHAQHDADDAGQHKDVLKN